MTLLESLAGTRCMNRWDESRDEMAQADEVYLSDRKDEDELEKRYESLDLTREQKIIINDYIACASTVNHRFADISYMCGVKHAVGLLASLGVIKGIEVDN